MNRCLFAVAVCCWLVLAGVGLGAEVAFSRPPAAITAGDRVLVSFAVGAPTDVEVAVLNVSNRVVRHLAAGVLGAPQPPPEPLKPGLAQELAWDGKDDIGNPAAGGPFRFRVRAGLKAEFDGFLAESKHWIGSLTGLATDAKGNLYIYSASAGPHRGYTYYLQVFNRKVEYQKTIMPMPSNLPVEKCKAFGVIPGRDGRFTPRNHFGTWPEFYPIMRNYQTICTRVEADGLIRIWDGLSMATLTTEGAAAEETFNRDIWAKRPNHYTVGGPMVLTPSPDGRLLYLSGFRAEGHPDGRIYRMRNEPGAKMEPFVDVPTPAGGFEYPGKGTSYPQNNGGTGGAACDKDGNLLVCDRMNGMVRVYSPEGKEIGGFKVEWPQYIGCSHRTGAIYIMTNRFGGYQSAEKNLLKFPGWKGDVKEVARLSLMPKGYDAIMTLEDSVSPAVIWAGGQHGQGSWLLRIEDRDGKFELTGDLVKDLSTDRFGVKPRMAVHPETDLVICNDGAATLNGYDGLTGKEVKLPFSHGADMGVGLDGNWYVQVGNGYSGPICRFDRDLKPIPVPGADAKTPNRLGDVYGRMGAGYCTVGLAADTRGRVYSMQMYGWAPYCVAIYGPDGKPEDPGRLKDDPVMKKAGRFASALVAPMETKTGGIQLDYKGNIYIGLGVVPVGHTPPPGFEKEQAYDICVGSVIRFKPEGGAIVTLPVKDPAPPAGKEGLVMEHRSHYHRPRFLENATRAYPDLGSLGGTLGDPCMCRQPMFQVDGWGRIFYPNAITCSVRAVDNAGNEILKFGEYGNIDSRGNRPDSMIKKPDVPLGWPQAVGVSHKAIYVSDVVNRRIMRLLKQYSAEHTCEVKK